MPQRPTPNVGGIGHACSDEARDVLDMGEEPVVDRQFDAAAQWA